MKNVTVIANTKKDPTLEVTKKTVSILSKHADAVYMDKSLAYDAQPCVSFVEADSLFENTEAVITIGGDGTHRVKHIHIGG